jgi:hypothetical protein
VPLVDAVSNILLDVLSWSKSMLPLAVWQSTCDKLERRWAALAQNATAYAKARKLPEWLGVASTSRHVGGESHRDLLLNALKACGHVVHALAACMPAACRECCRADDGAVWLSCALCVAVYIVPALSDHDCIEMTL